ncbi:prolipoprotein diacylglyceryl transferase [candidate division KSB3 bacterium]|uniref:Phosphatidylglycerol--prolipoprotein diacylglyceryl transferase n=1 Tax=candidate division KSB3 bacterium TaxID=2044937 RepID=A0A2G6KAX2_9BACT|nr:MAG: prolipoprotein diacylglyceryl transferase [candidate division KSB3 bacterium]
MHPIFFEIGPLQIRFYGLMYAIAITCALYILRQEIRRKAIPLSEDGAMNFVILAVIGGIVGARLYYVVFHWEYYRHDLWEIVKVWHGGLAIHGGLIGGTLVGWWFTKRHRLSFWKMADIVAPCAILGQTFGRFGNFMNGDAHGVPTTMPWGMTFPSESIAGREFPGMPLHPTMLYEMAINFSIFLCLWTLRKRPWKDGFLACLYIVLYSIGRFIVSFFRADSLMLGPFRAAHVISILLLVVAGGWMVIHKLWEENETTPKRAYESGKS